MLPRPARLTRSDGFTTAVRGGRRAGNRLLVVHLAQDPETSAPAQVGLVVSKAVGPAVVRNRVKRRLRHLVRQRLSLLPTGSVLVLRAQPASGQASYAELDRALGRGVDRILGHDEHSEPRSESPTVPVAQ